ncbi:hypothetical protein [Eggerthella timonensis]|uniref:hypothetical protein n=1 Tax=Eggerthella timonensis TaxID=1871008 RepID=UPI000C760440|nr:hypothetical protein [Eggerthella timonensis]
MYTVNMIDLQSSEYDELALLVEAEEHGDNVKELATNRLQPNGAGFDDRRSEVYRGLDSVGLITGFSVDDGFVFFELTQKGIDFIRDYEASVAAEKKRSDDQRRHDYKVASYGAVAGGILGLFSGALGSWLLSWLSYFFNR